jgi:hypothetical protein
LSATVALAGPVAHKTHVPVSIAVLEIRVRRVPSRRNSPSDRMVPILLGKVLKAG